MTEYPLKLSEAELDRYRLMADFAARDEADLWTAAGIVEGAAVADVGCGPGAIAAVLGRLVGPGGRVEARDRDPDAVEAARAMAGQAGLSNVSVAVGDADATGIEPGSVDVVMIRHVLAHNGGHEEVVVDHAASLVRPGGAVYLVDIDIDAFRIRPSDPDIDDLGERYHQWHRTRGNDLAVGLRLGELLTGAGLEDVRHHGRYLISPVQPGFRPPGWAGRDALVADGLATADDVARWDAAFIRVDAAETRPTIFAPLFLAFGRRPGA